MMSPRWHVVLLHSASDRHETSDLLGDQSYCVDSTISNFSLLEVAGNSIDDFFGWIH